VERIILLREQASVLRTLATSFDVLNIRDQLLDIAARCEEMVKSIEENPQGAGLGPPNMQPDLH